MIPIRISNPIENKSVNVFALIDTGADNCVFPQTIAERTGHNLKGDGVLNYISQGVGEQSITVSAYIFDRIIRSKQKNYSLEKRTKAYWLFRS